MQVVVVVMVVVVVGGGGYSGRLERLRMIQQGEAGLVFCKELVLAAATAALQIFGVRDRQSSLIPWPSS